MPITPQELVELYPDQELLFADGFEAAIIGMIEGWRGGSRVAVVCYDYDTCIEILVERDGMDEDAEEFFEFNVLGAYVGDLTPVFLRRWS